MKLKDWVDRLIWATIFVTVVRYSAAFMASDLGKIEGIASEIVTFFLTLTGLGMGLLDTLGGGLLFNGWSKVFPKTGSKWSLKFKVLTFCVLALITSGMVILVPFTVSRLAHESVLETLGGKESNWTWIWSGMVNFIPYILIIGVFAGNKIVSSIEEESGQKVSGNLPEKETQEEKVSSNLPTDWRKIKDKLTNEQVSFIAKSDPKDIVKAFADSGLAITPRTASNWRVYAQEENQIRLRNGE
jgi:hypothetical protein